MMITDLRHFLNENDEIPDELTSEAKELLQFFGHIVEAATYVYERPTKSAGEVCRSVYNGSSCPGELEVWVSFDNSQIGWECSDCDDEGFISNWEGTQWDRRDYVRH